MRVATSLSIDRTSLSLSPLVLTNDPHDANPYTYPEEGLAEPNFPMRSVYAPDSIYTPGRLLLGTVTDGTTMVIAVIVSGESMTEVQANKNALAAAVAQFDYTVTMTVAGVEVGTWPAQPCVPAWGVVDHGMALSNLASGSLTIPVNPIGA